jgi:hypothetical protein
MPGVALLRMLLAVCVSAAVLGASADEIELRDARVTPTEEGLALAAEFDFDFNPRLAEVVANGVPLYFVVEFELTRKRWWWFDEKAVAKRMQLRLAYHPLSRHYRLSTGLLQQNFVRLEEALAVLRRVRNWVVVERAAPLPEGNYEAMLRMRLDVTLLPKPFQLSAITSRELILDSGWRRFAFQPAAPTAPAVPAPPAPAEAREPKEEPR